MDRVRRILVAVDFSPCSAGALREAGRIASWTKGSLTAIHVVDAGVTMPLPDLFMPTGIPMPAGLQDGLMERAQRRWQGFLREAQGPDKTPLRIVVGNPRDAILQAVRDEKPDLLVVGAHSTEDAGRVMGTTAAACVQWAPAKVLVVRAAQAGPFRSVLACVDFTETSALAVDQAISIAAQDGAALHVLHAYADPWQGTAPPESVRTNMPDFAERYRGAVESRLREFCNPLTHELNALRPEFHARQSPRYADGIMAYARERGCDLVVLGTRGRWNMRDYFWGSTAERVVRECPCSILAVKPAGFERLEPAGRFTDAQSLRALRV